MINKAKCNALIDFLCKFPILEMTGATPEKLTDEEKQYVKFEISKVCDMLSEALEEVKAWKEQN